MPTMTVSAPRSLIMWATSRRVRVANESMTSRAVTSTITPRARTLLTDTTSVSRSCLRSSSVRADCTVAMRYAPCLRIGTCTTPSPSLRGGGRRRLLQRHDLVAQEPLGLFDTALEVADGVHLAEVDADVDERLGDLGRQAGDDDDRAQEARCLDRLHQVVGDGRVDVADSGDVQRGRLRPVGPDAAQELLGELARALRVDDADDWQDEQTLADLEHRSRQLTDRLLLLANDALALLDEPDGDRAGNPVGGRLVGVEDTVQLVEILAVLVEERAAQHVAEQQHDPDDFVRLDPSGNDALGEVPRVRLQGLVGARLQGLDVVVIHRGRLGEDL